MHISRSVIFTYKKNIISPILHVSVSCPVHIIHVIYSPTIIIIIINDYDYYSICVDCVVLFLCLCLHKKMISACCSSYNLSTHSGNTYIALHGGWGVDGMRFGNWVCKEQCSCWITFHSWESLPPICSPTTFNPNSV